MKVYKLYGLIVFFLLLSCEGGSTIEEPQPTLRTANDVINDFKKLTINPGVNDLRLESLERGVFWNFRVIGPTSASEGNRRPLVMTFHGASGGSTSAHQHTDCYDEPGLVELDAFIIAPNAGFAEWYEAQNQQMVLALLDLAKTNWFVDTTKVLATGYSNGGNASWFYADFYPEQFTAAIPMASSYNPKRQDGSIPKIDVPMYVIHGEDDELFPVAQTEIFVNLSKDAGSSIEFVIAPSLTHYKPCEYVDVLKTGVTWVQNNVWN